MMEFFFSYWCLQYCNQIVVSDACRETDFFHDPELEGAWWTGGGCDHNTRRLGMVPLRQALVILL